MVLQTAAIRNEQFQIVPNSTKIHLSILILHGLNLSMDPSFAYTDKVASEDVPGMINGPGL